MGALSRAEFRRKLLESRSPQERPAVTQRVHAHRRSPPKASSAPSESTNVLSIDNHHAGGRPDHKVIAAMELYREKLAEGPQLSSELSRELVALGVSIRTANRARRTLGITAYQRSGKWWLEAETHSDEPTH